MDWYYAEGGQSLGPVSDDEFQSLVSSGKIGSDTLVWHDGMEDWLPHSQVGQTTPAEAPRAAVLAITRSPCSLAISMRGTGIALRPPRDTLRRSTLSPES